MSMPVNGKKSHFAKQNRRIMYISNIITQLLVTAGFVFIHVETHSKLSSEQIFQSNERKWGFNQQILNSSICSIFTAL